MSRERPVGPAVTAAARTPGPQAGSAATERLREERIRHDDEMAAVALEVHAAQNAAKRASSDTLMTVRYHFVDAMSGHPLFSCFV